MRGGESGGLERQERQEEREQGALQFSSCASRESAVFPGDPQTLPGTPLASRALDSCWLGVRGCLLPHPALQAPCFTQGRVLPYLPAQWSVHPVTAAAAAAVPAAVARRELEQRIASGFQCRAVAAAPLRSRRSKTGRGGADHSEPEKEGVLPSWGSATVRGWWHGAGNTGGENMCRDN